MITNTRFAGRVLALALGAAMLPAAAQAESFGGQARVISGDTLMVGAREVRLLGVEAPEASQRCDLGGTTWRCGEAATQKLSQLVTGLPVYCIAAGTDKSGRVNAVCAAGLTDLNRTLIAQGLATAQRGRGDVYLAIEAGAKSRKLGIWAGTGDADAASNFAFTDALK